MQKYIAKNWGYKIISENSFSFFHVLLSEIGIKKLLEQIPGIAEIIVNRDKSIVVYSESLTATLRNIIEHFENIEKSHLETKPAYFTVSTTVANKIHQWREVHTCAIALLVCKKFNVLEWGIANADVKTIFVADVTIALYDTYPKVIHPVSIINYAKRLEIEHFVAEVINKIGKYCRNRKSNDVGSALISFASKELGMSKEAVIGLIQYKLYHQNAHNFINLQS